MFDWDSKQKYKYTYTIRVLVYIVTRGYSVFKLVKLFFKLNRIHHCGSGYYIPYHQIGAMRRSVQKKKKNENSQFAGIRPCSIAF